MPDLDKAVAAVVASWLLVSCTGTPPLVTRSAVVPMGVDLSGQWRLIGDAQADMLEPMHEDILVDVFLENGAALKLTQTAHGLFVSFDRSVVEEYRFGENRLVNVGAVQAERASGWQDGGYLIETRDKEGAVLTETYRLSDGGDTLTRTATITYRNRPEYEHRQVFEKDR